MKCVDKFPVRINFPTAPLHSEPQEVITDFAVGIGWKIEKKEVTKFLSSLYTKNRSPIPINRIETSLDCDEVVRFLQFKLNEVVLGKENGRSEDGREGIVVDSWVEDLSMDDGIDEEKREEYVTILVTFNKVKRIEDLQKKILLIQRLEAKIKEIMSKLDINLGEMEIIFGQDKQLVCY